MTQEMKDTFKEIGELFLKMADQLEKYEEKEVDEDNWIKWEGGDMPVPKGTRVDVKHRDRDVFQYQKAGSGYAERWHHDDCIADIIAYKIVKDNK